MLWDKETILHFIGLIRERPAIWDIESAEHKDRQKRQEAYEEVALLMGITTKAVYTKWTTLRNQYSREKRKIAGCPTNLIYMPKWYAYKDMESIMSGNSIVESMRHYKEDDSSEEQSPPNSPTSPTPSAMSSATFNTQTRATFPSVRQGKKRESDARNTILEQAVETLRVIRESQNERSLLTDDELTTYGLYIAAHLRKFSPHLQSKAKYQINNLLYELDMESLEEYNTSTSSMK